MKKSSSPRNKCLSTRRVTARFLLSFLAVSSPVVATWADSWSEASQQEPLLPYLPPPQESNTGEGNILPAEHDFTLRHVFHHGARLYPNLHRRLDVDLGRGVRMLDEEREDIPANLRARSNAISIQRLSDRRPEAVESLLSAARLDGRPPTLPPAAWRTDEVSAPNVTDKETVLSLSLMAANAYNEGPGIGDWEDVKHGFNYSQSFGWENDGLQGHIFADKRNSTIVISLKGTSAAVFDGAGTTTRDKENDNLFSGCCCGQGGQYLWKTVCDCTTEAFSCNETCVIQSMRERHRYYQAATELFTNVTEIYPASDVWITGHSLGGVVSSLLGLTYGVPVVTFEAYGDALAAGRLGLPRPPELGTKGIQARQNTGAHHFGHTADPVFMGTCNTATSGCTIAGYALQSQCHTGKICIYDVVEDKKWRVSLTTHSIRAVIRDVIRAYDDVPPCISDEECVDCYNWKRFYSNGSEITTTRSATSTTTSTTYTRTETCKTPGWFGCLDPTTTVTTTTSSSSSVSTTSTSTTVTCTHYGWFGGCLDPTTTSKPASTVAMTFTPTRTPSATPSTSSQFSQTTCLTPGIIWGCRDKTTSAMPHSITARPGL